MFKLGIVRKLRLNSLSRVCQLCCQTVENTDSTENNPKGPSKKCLTDLNKFIKQNPHIRPLQNRILKSPLCSYKIKPERLYLVCSNVARDIAKHILNSIRSNENQMICETNPGFGLLTDELLKGGVNKLRLFEQDSEFRNDLKTLFEERTDQLEFFDRDISNISYYKYLDSLDNGNRINNMFSGIPKKEWTDDPVMTIIGPMPTLSFIKYLTMSLVTQSGLVRLGRVDMFMLTYPKNWAFLVDSVNIPTFYRYRVALNNIFFDVELLGKYDRNLFMPWQNERKNKSRLYPLNLEPDQIYFLKVSMKKQLDINFDQILPLFVFLKNFIAFKNRHIIPTLESWVPDSGKNIIAPKLHHKDYFHDIDIYTKFSELSAPQIIALFKEMIAHPNYLTSPFLEMVEMEQDQASDRSNLSDINIISNAPSKRIRNIMKELRV